MINNAKSLENINILIYRKEKSNALKSKIFLSTLSLLFATMTLVILIALPYSPILMFSMATTNLIINIIPVIIISYRYNNNEKKINELEIAKTEKNQLIKLPQTKIETCDVDPLQKNSNEQLQNA